MSNLMRIEVWTDIHCPWCYLGKRRFEKALAQFEQRDQVSITWRSYQLDADLEREYPGSINDMLAEKKGISRQQAEQMHAQLTVLAAEDGLDYHFEKARVGNTFDAHRMVHLAAKHELADKMEERLMKAYFTEGLSVSDTETLVRLAAEVGLDANEARAMLNGDSYANDVLADERRAMSIGVRGVPFFLFDEKYAVSGAQRQETFLTALRRTWEDLHREAAGAGAD